MGHSLGEQAKKWKEATEASQADRRDGTRSAGRLFGRGWSAEQEKQRTRLGVRESSMADERARGLKQATPSSFQTLHVEEKRGAGGRENAA